MSKFGDFIALSMTKFFRFIADTFFANRYGHRAVVLETIAGVMSMVTTCGFISKVFAKWRLVMDPKIRELLAEAENERMHLMFFIEISKPNLFERLLVLLAQGIFFNFYFLMYVFFPRVAHRMVHYFEEEAVFSYTEYLRLVESGEVENILAPKLAIDYYGMKEDAKLSDLIEKVRADEIHHSEVNFKYSNE